MAVSPIKLPALPKMSKRERLMAIAFLAIFFVVLADRLAIGPWLAYIKKIRKEIKVLEHGIEQQKKLMSRRGIILAEAENQKDYLRPGEVPEMEMAAFLKEIEAVGKKSQLSLHEVKPLPTNLTDLYQEYGLEVHYECTFEQCLGFIYAVETLPGLYTIEKALMNVNQEKPSMLKGYFRIRRTVMENEINQERKNEAGNI